MRRRHQTATPAIRRTTQARPTRITPSRASPLPAKLVTTLRLGPARTSITTTRRSRSPALIKRLPAHCATLQATLRRRRKTATPAIKRNTPPPPTRITSRRDSPPPAPIVTTPQHGQARSSTTTTRRSRSPGHTKRLPAQCATPQATLRRRRLTATPAIKRNTPPQPIRITSLRISQQLARLATIPLHGRVLSSTTTTRVSRSLERTSPWLAHFAIQPATLRRRRQTATPAIKQTGTALPIRITSRRDSRPPAQRATTQPPGPARSSTTTTRRSRSPALIKRLPAHCATLQATLRRRRKTATPAIKRNTPPQPTRITSRRDSPPPAPIVTTPQHGQARSSTTTTRRSRSPGHTKRLPAQCATPQATLRRRRLTATPAIKRNTPPQPIRITSLRISQQLARLATIPLHA